MTEDEKYFMDFMRGVPTYALARAMSGRRVSYVGCSKSHLAKAWAQRNNPQMYYGDLAKVDISQLRKTATDAVEDSKQRKDAIEQSRKVRELERLRNRVSQAVHNALPHLMLRQCVKHLDTVLNQCRSHCEQQRADVEARDFLSGCADLLD